MRVRLLPVLAASLLVTACGGGNDGAITIGSSTAPGGAATSLDEAQCAVFDSDDGPDETFVESMPKEYRAAAEAIAEFGDSMDAMGDNDDGSIDALVTSLTKDGVSGKLREFAAFIDEQCGTSEGSVIIAGLATASEMASEDKDAAYCDAIEAGFSTDDGGPEEIAALADIAPESHRDALTTLAAVDPSSLDDAAEDEVFGPLFGLGIYAEDRCGIDGALAQMLLGAMFMGMDDGGGMTTTSLPEGVDPAQYPDITADAANAALPAGSGITFSVQSADLEDDGDYLASMVVPEGWTSESNFNVEFSPPPESGASIFTSVEAGAGCDGTCEATDWDARLRGEMGFLTQFFASHPSATESPISGSEGVIVTDTTGDDVVGLVLRWDDGADKYFSCEVTLESEQADLLPAFVTACESSRPAWFAVG